MLKMQIELSPKTPTVVLVREISLLVISADLTFKRESVGIGRDEL